jgi:hypothetical protein
MAAVMNVSDARDEVVMETRHTSRGIIPGSGAHDESVLVCLDEGVEA